MLQLSSRNILLHKSTYLVYLAIVLHAYALYMIWGTAFAFGMKACIALLLVYRLWVILFPTTASQTLTLERLDFKANRWFLWNKGGTLTVYEKSTVILEAGIFFPAGTPRDLCKAPGCLIAP